MKSLILMLVLLVLAVLPLTASTDQGNTGFNFLRTSPIDSKEDSLINTELGYDHIAVLNVGLRKSYLLDATKSKQSVLIEKTGMLNMNNHKNKFGGAKRTNHRKH